MNYPLVHSENADPRRESHLYLLHSAQQLKNGLVLLTNQVLQRLSKSEAKPPNTADLQYICVACHCF